MPQIRQEQTDTDIALVHISGRITLGRECQDVEQAVDGLIRDGKKKIVLDLTDLNYMDSTGIGIIVMCSGKVKAAGGELRLAALQPRIAELMKMTRIDQIMQFYPTAAAATENFTLSQET